MELFHGNMQKITLKSKQIINSTCDRYAEVPAQVRAYSMKQ